MYLQPKVCASTKEIKLSADISNTEGCSIERILAKANSGWCHKYAE